MQLLHLKDCVLGIEDLGQRALTLDDFYRECDIRGIQVIEMPFSEILGITQTVEGVTFIGLNSDADIATKTFTAFHELGHALLSQTAHWALRSLRGVSNHPEWEREADDVALVAIIPRSDISRYGVDELCRRHALGCDQIERRLLIWLNHGF